MSWQTLDTYPEGTPALFWIDNLVTEWVAYGVFKKAPGDRLRNVWWGDCTMGGEKDVRYWQPMLRPEEEQAQ